MRPIVSALLVIVATILLAVIYAEPLKCYTGFKFIGGSSIGGETTMCADDSEYCYNMTAQGGILIDVSKAGCSFYRCLLARDSCIKQELNGIPVQFCCCSSGDLCNGNSH